VIDELKESSDFVLRLIRKVEQLNFKCHSSLEGKPKAIFGLLPVEKMEGSGSSLDLGCQI